MTIGKKITLGFGLSLAILVTIGILSYFSVTSLIANNSAVVHTDTVIANLDTLLSLMKDAETGQRGFIITGKADYLDPYNRATENLDQAVRDLRQLMAGDPSQERHLDKLEPLITGKVRELDKVIELRKSQGFDVAAKEVNDDIGKNLMDQVRKVIGDMKTQEKDLLAQRTHEAEASSRSALYAIGVGTVLAILLVQLAGFFITRSIVNPLRSVVEVSRNIAAGDLRAKKILATSDYEIRELAGEYDQMVDGLKDLTGQIRSVTENVNSAATQISASTRQQASSAKEQAATIQEITSTMQELGQSGTQIVEKAKEIAALAEATTAASGSGVLTVQQTSQTMEAIREQIEEVAENIVALSEKTQAIGEIISTVNDVAEQSNLLALNATIEAVAAGSHGSRFSVVASEMKNLSDQAKQCTVQVRTILGDIQKGINSSVMLTEEAVKRAESGKQQADVSQETIHRMTETTVASVQAFQQIIGATGQQQIGFEQVTRGMQDIQQATQETVSGTAQLRAGRPQPDLVEPSTADRRREIPGLMDTQQKVLAAYQIEHKEHLEGVRALLAELADNGAGDVQPRLEEAFRRVHSLKGGARVCGLQPVETIAHRLESHFSQLRLGTLPLDRSTIVVANDALDAIEDCMAALTENPPPPQSAPESTAADAASDAAVGRPSPSAAADEFALRIMAAFQAEHKDYLLGLRGMLERAIDRGEALAPSNVEEALRLAHSLHGAARVAGIETVERIGQTLESQWSQIRDHVLELDPDLGRRMGALLAEVEQHMAALAKPGGPVAAGLADGAGGRPAPAAGGERCTPAATAAAAGAARESAAEVAPEVAAETAAEAAPRTPAMPLADTVRVSAESLDQLLRSSSQLVAEAAHQDQIARELRQFERQLDDLERQRAAVRKGVAQALRRIESDSHGNRLDRYLDAMERQVQVLSAAARRIQRLHRSGAWLTKARSQQIHDDVRRTRMAPAESVFQGFRKMVRDLAKDEGKQVEFRITGYEVPADRMVLQALKDPLMHMLCNAVIHGIESPDERRARGKSEVGRISLKIEALGHRLCVTIEDDGRGIDRHRVGAIAVEAGLLSPTEAAACGPDEIAALVFRPGLSTAAAITKLSGAGWGFPWFTSRWPACKETCRCGRTKGRASPSSFPCRCRYRRTICC